ncbi:FUSC family protein [Roseibium aggregatum]|uniref:FUSC family protein n=1 Tax=Roseibium aggregatum TaxID=187304 RepID=A0A939J0U6_9HYPH|nr:FUSC family protein [Roseibium aggregatum]MBN9669658.1 FUSC family protein [Roseibium aggregatum]
MLQAAATIKTKLLRTDPGGLRLMRGVHLMLTVLGAVFLANVAAGLVPGQSAFKLAVLAAAAGGHCLMFTPVSTRRAEILGILKLGGLVTGLFALGAVAAALSGKNASSVLQGLWIGTIMTGFALQGLGAFWQRAGRIMAVCWLFVILSTLGGSPGIWLPVMAILGALVALVVRTGPWRPSTRGTYLRVEAANRRAMAGYLRQAAEDVADTASPAPVTIRDLAQLRTELQVCADLLQPDLDLKGMSPEAATMVELALEVVRDARGQLSEDGRERLARDPGFRASLEALANRLRTGEGGAVPSVSWVETGRNITTEDRFQELRMAQAFERLWILAARDTPVHQGLEPDEKRAPNTWWRQLSWRLSLQAGVAAAIGFALGFAFDLNHAYWVTLTVIIVLSNSLGATLLRTAQRIGGTAGGVVLAMLVDPALADFPAVRLVLVVIAIPAVIVFIDRNYAIASGIISFLVVMGLQTLEGLPIGELWSRLYDTMIGAGVGLAAAWLLFPNRTGAGYVALASDYLSACRDCLKGEGGEPEKDLQDLARLRTAASTLIATARSYRIEQAPWSSFTRASSDLNVQVIVLAQYVVLYREARADVLRATAGVSNAPDIEALIGRMNKRLEDEFDAVLEGREKQTVPGLEDDWMAAMPEGGSGDLAVMTAWVAMLYHARKILRCLDGLRAEKLLSAPA